MDIDLNTRSAAAAWVWCGGAAFCQFVAAALVVSVYASADFATDFENGTRTAGAGTSATASTVLLIIGIFCALVSIFHPAGSRPAATVGSLLLMGGCYTGLAALPLLGHY
ncbi:Uncharacterised protein [Mycolicibacterium tokaiense]|uniref:Transmembrane protein n=2 Tax=Mycolicibacterium tokaiense TaxID=39695 RepID=A0A378TJE9_9MYCO|nr:hypothetical protein MTOK_03520 [Mycolicibacterium tokaiense]STZ60922.1 Uncharacterised protein [Mycolicibacterium tokaiense]